MSISALSKDTQYYILARVCGVAYWGFLIRTLTDWLTPTQYGAFTLVMSSTVILGSFASTPRSAMLRFYGEFQALGPSQLNEYMSKLFSACLILICVLGFVATALSYVFPDFLPEELVFAISVIYFMMFCLHAFMMETYRASRNLRMFALFTAIQLALSGVLIIVLGNTLGKNLNSIFCALILSQVAVTAMMMINAKVKITFNWAGSRMKQAFDYGWPVIFINLLTQCLILGDQFIFRYFNRTQELGVYAANYAIAENSILAFTSLLGSAFIPILFQKAAAGENAERFIKTVRNVYLVIMLPVLILFVTMSQKIARFLVAPAYLEGSYILPIVSLGAFALGLSNVYSEQFTLQKRTKDLMLCYLFAAAVNVTANFIAIPRYGMTGAAWSTLASYCCLLIVVYWFGSQKNRPSTKYT